MRGVAVPPRAPVPKPASSLAASLTGFPPRILAAFAPRPAPPRWPPHSKKPPRVPYSGVGDLVRLFEEGGMGGDGDGDTRMGGGGGEEDEEGAARGRRPPAPAARAPPLPQPGAGRPGPH